MKYLFLAILAFVPVLALAQQPEFVPLTTLPGLNSIRDAAEAGSLSEFFNMLYRLCIGAAATIAIFNIMYAGFKSMTQEGSVLQKGETRRRITQSILGLLLVLSPAIVFGIVDPRILSLDIGNLDKLKLSNSSSGLSEQEREYIESGVRQAASECGFTVSEEEGECVTNDFGAVEECFAAELTAEQRSCFVGEMTERANEARQCENMNIRVGSEVESDFRQCCAQAGLEARQAGRSSSYVCVDPNAPQTGSGPVFETQPGYYNYLIFGQTDSCFQLMQGSFPDQAACETSFASESQSRSFSTLMSCKQISGSTFTSSFSINEDAQLCSAIIKVP